MEVHGGVSEDEAAPDEVEEDEGSTFSPQVPPWKSDHPGEEREAERLGHVLRDGSKARRHRSAPRSSINHLLIPVVVMRSPRPRCRAPVSSSSQLRMQKTKPWR